MSDDDLPEAQSDVEADDDSADMTERVTDAASRSTEWASKTKQWLVTTALSPALGIGAGMSAADSVGGSRVPGTTRVWKWLLKTSHRGLKRSTNADLLGYEMKRGHLLIKPLIYQPDTERWETKNGETWWRGREDGVDIYTGPGGVSCAWGASRSNQLGTEVQAEVAEAFDLGYGKVVTTNAQVNVQQVTPAAAGQARSDGGVTQQVISPNSPGVLEDYLIPLNKLYVDDDELVDTRMVSATKYYQAYPEVAESEEHQKAEERARIAERNEDYTDMAWKFFVAALVFVLLAIAAMFGLPEILSGSGGGGGGGLIPLAVGSLGGF